MKKILIFSLDYYPGEVGGAEIAIKEITNRLNPSEFEFHLITMRYDSLLSREEQIGNVHVYRIGFGRPNPSIRERRSFPLHLNKHLFQLTAALKGWQLYRQHRFDGLWAMMAHACGVPAALFKLMHPEVRYVLTLQEGDPPEEIEHKARPVWPLFKRAFTSADTIQVISSFLGAWAKRMGYSGEPVLIPNAVTTAHFSQTYTAAELAETRRELNAKEDDVLIVTTSRLVSKNGLGDVIRALSQLPEQVKFIIFGNGPSRDELEELAKRERVINRVQFRGLIDHSVMPRYLQACDIFIRPSRSEGMGNSFVEAMAAGLPVIATQAGGIADFLFDSKRNPELPTTGWAVDIDAPEQIAAAVVDIMEHLEKVQQVTTTARRLVTEQYDWDVVAKRMEAEVFRLTLQMR